MSSFPRRTASTLLGAFALTIVVVPVVSAQPVHQVESGESLWQVAAANGMSPATLAVANGLSADAGVQVGQVLTIPPQTSPSTAEATVATTSEAAGSSPSSSADASAASGAPVAPPATAPGVASGAGRLTAEQIGSIAAENGVSPALARAIAWQESGFNNAAVSRVGARGIMQVMPGTWDWIGRNLSSSPLDPASAADNVRAGTLYLGHLLRETGGDPDQAAAGYYQGLASVRSRGEYDDTQRYVQNVRALRARFGG